MTSNPMSQEKVYSGYVGVSDEPMTVAGTVNKTLLLLAIASLVAIYTWTLAFSGFSDKLMLLVGGGAIAGFVLAIITAFKPQHAKLTGIAYAVCEGFVLGGISAMYHAAYHGIVTNAVLLTFGAMFSMLALYKTGLIKATERFRAIIMTAIGGIMVFYLISIIGSFFFKSNIMAAAFDGGPLAIGISLLIVGVAAFSFILDFDFIEKGAQVMAPKFMEWYGAFTLLVTLVWLYLEMLRLLSYFAKRD